MSVESPPISPQSSRPTHHQRSTSLGEIPFSGKRNSLSFESKLPEYRQRSASLHEIKKQRDKERLLDDQQKKQINETGINAPECIECIQAIPVVSSNELEDGDHVVFSGAVYDHHGIICKKEDDDGTFTIVEATNTPSRAFVGISKVFGGKAKLEKSSMKFDFEKQKIRVVVYRYRFSKTETAERALHFFNAEKSRESFIYDLLNNNCEHFATFCVTGKKSSMQVSKFKLTWRLFWRGGIATLSDEMERNESGYGIKLICNTCYGINKNLLGVSVKPIVLETDIQIGDIIRYSYWYLWHEAVVLEKTKVNKKTVECIIAHYAFCGPFSHRTIKKEDKTIRLDEQCLKLCYAPPQYDVYNPAEVVERAQKRIGEQCFSFYSNDSSHFARWCKLKLWKSTV